MIRLAASLRRDALNQYRQGLYAVTLFLVAVFAVLLSLLPPGLREYSAMIVPPFLAVNLIITTFYFTAAMVLLEKGEGMLPMLIVTPLRPWEYLASKSITLSLLALVETFLILLPFFGLDFSWLLLTTGAILLGAIYCLSGFTAVIRFGSINTFLLPSVLWVTILVLPLLSHFGLLPRWFFFWHPLEPGLTLARSAFSNSPGWQPLYGLIGSVFWIGMLLVLAGKGYERFAVEPIGGGS